MNHESCLAEVSLINVNVHIIQCLFKTTDISNLEYSFGPHVFIKYIGVYTN